MTGPIWGVTGQIVEQAPKSTKVDKLPAPSGVTSDLIKAAGSTEMKGFVNPLNRKERFQSSGARVIPYRYIKVREMS